VKRGEIWTASGGRDYAGKPRPVVIVQDDRFAATASITVCPFTSDPTDAPLLWLAVKPSATNGLRGTSRLMVDKLTTMRKENVGSRIGRLADDDVVRLNRAILMFLGLAG
jgi:mRNA interferase MazF